MNILLMKTNRKSKNGKESFRMIPPSSQSARIMIMQHYVDTYMFSSDRKGRLTNCGAKAKTPAT